MATRRLLITGGSSYLGQHLVAHLSQSGGYEFCYTFYQHDPLDIDHGRHLNILDYTGVKNLVRDFQPDVIIHTVGSNRGPDMEAVIRQGTTHITRAASAVAARLIHISTDVIFDGRHAPYLESSLPNPLNAYGHAKAEAESIVIGHDNYVIVRTSLIYGLRKMDHGTRWIVAALRAGEPVTLFSNQRRNPVWTKTLSAACLELAANEYVGILNVAGDQALSRADFALRMLDWWQVKDRETVNVGADSGEQRPLDCELDLRQAKAILSTPLLGVDAVLEAARGRSATPQSSQR